jgi:hypothetical protein
MPRKKQNHGKGQGKGKGQDKEKASLKAQKTATQKAAPKKAKRTAPKKAKGQGPGKARVGQKGVGKRPKVRPRSATTEHWLRRPETIRRLWIGGLFALAGLVAVEVWVYTHGYFGIDGLFAFNAWFGFVSCVAMIFISNGLGKLLKREDTYYDLD